MKIEKEFSGDIDQISVGPPNNSENDSKNRLKK